MKKFIISLCFCIGSLIENGFSMMDYDTSPAQQKRIVSKGFKPLPQLQSEKLNSAKKKQTPSEEGPLLYDPERDMYYYGKNLSEAAKKDNNSTSSKTVTNSEIISLEDK